MPDDSATAEAPPRISSTAAVQTSHASHSPLRLHVRVWHGTKRPHNWVQLFKFCTVGGSGYVVNLFVFWVAAHQFGLHYLASATVAFVVAVFNNFWWNRHWTFGAGEGHAGWQAGRFFAVSVVAFLFALGVLQLLVDSGMNQEIAQALSIVAATPLNFLGNKMWSFGSSVPARRS